jgi:hypothetical protein
MTNEIKSKIEGLRHAIYVCDCKNISLKNEAYRAACAEIKLSLEASIERLEEGGIMESIAYTQKV